MVRSEIQELGERNHVPNYSDSILVKRTKTELYQDRRIPHKYVKGAGEMA